MPPLGFQSVSVKQSLVDQVRVRLWRERLPQVQRLLNGELVPQAELRLSVASYVNEAIQEKLERDSKVEGHKPESSQSEPPSGA